MNSAGTPLQELQIGEIRCQIAASTGRPSAVLVLVHGYAMDAGHLAPLAIAMGAQAALYLPSGLLEVPGGGRSWWPLDEERRHAALAQGPRDLSEEYPTGRARARAALLAVVRHAQAHHPGLPIVVAGFSQGGMLACDTVLHEQLAVQGLILLSSSRIAAADWRPRLHRLRGLPVLIAHGTRDPDLGLSAGERLRDELRAVGADVTWLAFDGGHEIPFTVWRSVKRLLRQIAQQAARA